MGCEEGGRSSTKIVSIRDQDFVDFNTNKINHAFNFSLWEWKMPAMLVNTQKLTHKRRK